MTHVDNPIKLTGGSFFSGVGMLDEAVKIALARRGIEYRTAFSCEWESGASATLLARMEEQSVEPHPVWCGDLRDFPSRMFAGRIDIITAGYPCQPFSRAGLQRGLEDERAMGDDGDGPIAQLLRHVKAIGPRFVFLENVGAALEYFPAIGQELESMGYEIAPPILLAAEDIGASHKRERMFILGELADCVCCERRLNRDAKQCKEWSASARGGKELENSSRNERGQRPRWERTGTAVQEVADAESERGRSEFKSGCEEGLRRAGPERASGPLAVTSGERLQGKRPNDGETGREKQNGSTGLGWRKLFAPGPGDHAEWLRTLTDQPHLAPAVESEIRVLVDGVAYVVDSSRADQLRCTGNGVVALQGAAAFELHLREFGY